MADWTTIRLNLGYHWRTVLLWGIGIVGMLVFTCWTLSERAEAWVEDFQPFPAGEATVVVHRFCRSQNCNYPVQAEWRAAIQAVVNQWNSAGSSFTFHTRALRSTDNPCQLPGTVTVLLADPDQLCPGDGPMRFGARTEYQYRDGFPSPWQVRVYINADWESSEDIGSITRLLLHEFGHAVGLGHPDDAGQNVAAVMNSVVYDNDLQADDIAGMQALYPPSMVVDPSRPSRPAGLLENPGDGSSRSGIGVISGWVCEADEVTVELSGRRGLAPYHQVWRAAYGTTRADTQGVCGDTNNGFGLLFNWNNLGDGTHTVVTFVDGVELGRATVTVTTLGAEFLRGAAGRWTVGDFPTLGETVTLVWQQNSQNFVIAGGSPPAGATTGRTSVLTGFLENPGHNSFQSGISMLSGWVCEADLVEVDIGGLGRQAAAYGTERTDTAEVCGDTDNGFGLLFNWNLLGDGEHTVIAYVDGEELGRADIRVTTLGEEFLRGTSGRYTLEGFPGPGESVVIEWEESLQNFVITDGASPPPPPSSCTTKAALATLDGLQVAVLNQCDGNLYY